MFNNMIDLETAKVLFTLRQQLRIDKQYQAADVIRECLINSSYKIQEGKDYARMAYPSNIKEVCE